MNNDQWLSILRTVLKVAGTALVSFGIADQGQVSTFTTGLADTLGAGLVLWGAIWSHFHHAGP